MNTPTPQQYQSKYLPIQVTPVTAVEPEGIADNIKENLVLMKTWLSKTYPITEGKAFLVSAGPSLTQHLERLKQEYVPGKDVICCVKHALPILVKAGITPDFCLVLDARDPNGVSTHGVVRKTLFTDIPKSTKFLVASMTHPETVKYLLDNGADVVGFHTLVKGLEDVLDVSKEFVTMGGSCAATRLPVVMQILGYRKYVFIGYDGCLDQVTPEALAERDNKDRPKYFAFPVQTTRIAPYTAEDAHKFVDASTSLHDICQRNGYNMETRFQKIFWVTGEFVALAQDLEVWLEQFFELVDIDFWEGGVGYELFFNVKDSRKPRSTTSFDKDFPRETD